jgi:4-carboxymuconolactone decarboxylase
MAHIIDALYGSIWSRDEIISLPERSLITVAVLVALNRENELKIHIRGALNLGVSKEKIEEMILHVAHYSGFPTGVSANQILNEIVSDFEKEK